MARRSQKTYLIWLPTFLIIYNFCANLSNDIYLPSLPTLVKVFGTTPTASQLTMTAWFAGVMLPQLFLGPLSDKIGRRPVLFSGGICFLLATLICAVSQGIDMLILARFFQGVGVCSLNVTTFSILADLYSYRERIHITNKISMWGNIAPLIGPVIGGFVLIWLGWQANFVIIFLAALFGIVGLWFVLPETNSQLNPRALNSKQLYRTYTRLIKNKLFLNHLLPYCLMLGGLIVYLIAAPFVIITKLKISPENFGFIQIPIFSAYILGSIYINFITDEVKIKQRLKNGINIALCGSMMMVVNCLFDDSLILFIIPMVFYSLGFSLCASSMVTESMSAAGQAKGAAAAFLGFGMAASCMLASFVLGLVYNGTIISIASLLFIIVSIASILYFQPYFNREDEKEKLSVASTLSAH